MLFVRFRFAVARSWAVVSPWFPALLSLFPSFAVVCFAGGGLVGSPWLFALPFVVALLVALWRLFAVLCRASFLCVPCPRPWRGGLPWFVGFWSVFRWSCVAPSALPALRRSVFVCRVVPAVVCLRSGLVVRVWVLWCPAPA